MCMGLQDYTSNCQVLRSRPAFIVSIVIFYIHMDILKLLNCVSTAHLLVLILLVYSGAFG